MKHIQKMVADSFRRLNDESICHIVEWLFQQVEEHEPSAANEHMTRIRKEIEKELEAGREHKPEPRVRGSRTQEAVATLVHNTPGLTVAEISSILKIPNSSAWALAYRLRGNGTVKFKGSPFQLFPSEES